jgi:hypothetical protein
MIDDRLHIERLLAEAFTAAGHDDLGEPSWQDGLVRLVSSLREEARLNDLGVEIVIGSIVRFLTNRAGIVAWRKLHADVARRPIQAPIFVVGQPRSGTTFLFGLLSQDPSLRAPLTWEVERPLPPPETATYASDPRIAEVQADVDLFARLDPVTSATQPMGATQAADCSRVSSSAFRSMMFPIYYHVPSFRQWVLHEADVLPTYQWHRTVLQHLQLRHRGGRSLLKSFSHLWHLDALAAVYPDATIVRVHRDPVQVISSMAALSYSMKRIASDHASLQTEAAEWVEDSLLALDRSVDARERKVFRPGQIIDLHYADLVGNPVATIDAVYEKLGRGGVGTDIAQRMLTHLARTPVEHTPTIDLTAAGIDVGSVRERAQRYMDHFGVPSEPDPR